MNLSIIQIGGNRLYCLKKLIFEILIIILCFNACSNTIDNPEIAEGEVNRGSFFSLEVRNGSGAGIYFKGQLVPIRANIDSSLGKFSHWEGDVDSVENVFNSNTNVKIIDSNLRIIAKFGNHAPPHIKYRLSVVKGNGSGEYGVDEIVFIKANPPTIGKEFLRWMGSEELIENVNSSETRLRMPNHDVSISAKYESLELKYTLNVENGNGGGQYLAGTKITVSANPNMGNVKFTNWEDSSHQIEGSNNRIESLIMPAGPLTVKALFNQVEENEDLIGIVNHRVTLGKIQLLNEANIKWSRIGIDWFHTKDPCGKILPNDLMTKQVKDAVANGINIFATLGSGPQCASVQSDDDNAFNDVPKIDLWKKYLENTVMHYRKLGVKHFGIWNEPNLKMFFEGSVDQMIELYIEGIPAMRRGCAKAGFNDCFVMGPELSHARGYDKYLSTIIERLKSKKLSFDIWTHHIYNRVNANIFDGDSFETALEKPRLFQSKDPFLVVLKEHGLASSTESFVPVWITEVGYNTNRENGPNELQKQYDEIKSIVKFIEKRRWVKRIFVYQLVDSPDPQFSGWGITYKKKNGDYVKKPAFNFIKNYLSP